MRTSLLRHGAPMHLPLLLFVAAAYLLAVGSHGGGVLPPVAAAATTGAYAAGRYTLPESVYFPDASNPFQAFEAALPYATGLLGNGTTLNVAVPLMCASYTNTSFSDVDRIPFVNSTLVGMAAKGDSDALMQVIASLKAMRRTAAQIVDSCERGPAYFNGFYNAFILLQQRINSMCNGGVSAATAGPCECGIPMQSRFHPLTGHQVRVKLNLVFFYMGPYPFPGTPDAKYLKQVITNAAVLGQFLATPLPAPFGFAIGRFPLVIPPPHGFEPFYLQFSVPCELTKNCISISAYGGSKQYLRCVRQPTLANASVIECPVECLQTYGSCGAQRRFNFGVSYLFDQRDQMSYVHTLLKLQGAHSIAVLMDGRSVASNTVASIDADLHEKGFDVLLRKVMPIGTIGGQDSGVALSQEEIDSLAHRIKELNPDIVSLVGETSQQSTYISSYAKLVLAFKKLNWAPKAIVGGAGNYGALASMIGSLTGDPLDGRYILGSLLSDYSLRGRAFQTRLDPPDPDAVLSSSNPSVNFEPFVPDDSHEDGGGGGASISSSSSNVHLRSAGEVFRDEYVRVWGNGEGATYDLYHGNLTPQIAAGLVMIASKLAEVAASDDPHVLQAATYRISTASFSGLLQFDPLGRLVPQEQPVVQLNEQLGYELLTPADVATTKPVYPLPTWEQRSFKPEQFATANEKAVLVVTSVSLGVLATIFAFVALKREHPVLKASSPPFSLLSLLGAMMTVASNYGLSMQPTATGCAVNVWLLTVGLTLMLASLLVKLGRLAFIFTSGRLTVARITNTHLGLLLAAIMVVDVLLNAIWSGVAPFDTKVVEVDVFRPSFNYRACAWTEAARSVMYVHLAWKSLLVIAALVLAILTRSLPAAYNESTYLGTCVYNLIVLLVFLVPIVSTGTGGRATTYLLHAFGVQLLVLSTMLILFVPKFITMSSVDAQKKRQKLGLGLQGPTVVGGGGLGGLGLGGGGGMGTDNNTANGYTQQSIFSIAQHAGPRGGDGVDTATSQHEVKPVGRRAVGPVSSLPSVIELADHREAAAGGDDETRSPPTHATRERDYTEEGEVDAFSSSLPLPHLSLPPPPTPLPSPPSATAVEGGGGGSRSWAPVSPLPNGSVVVRVHAESDGHDGVDGVVVGGGGGGGVSIIAPADLSPDGHGGAESDDVPPSAALVAQLRAEIAQLRAKLQGQ